MLSRLLPLLLTSALLTPTASSWASETDYVGAAACAQCHPTQLKLWRGSHHDRAMQKPTTETVVGNFDGTTFTTDGVTSKFSREPDKFIVTTQGPDGEPHPYAIAYTFGITPLQQYLVEFPRGAFQALTTAWDSRPKKAGGQRWFDLHPDEATPPGDVLHWTGPGNTWNRMCADCHSTNVRSRFIVPDRRYETTWSEINVACEACHGPGKRHVEWAKAEAKGAPQAGSVKGGLSVDFNESRAGSWVMSGETGIARLDRPRSSKIEIETCAPCHSRRAKIADHAPGEAFLDAYRPALLEEDLYFADGQMDDEVYVWGSFVQSRMFAAGVTCGDCHEPHSLRLRTEGNAMCTKCHAAAKFDTASHHHHARASRAALCVECHMPSRTYMVIDDRRDHSFRVPRPAVSHAVGSPDVCSGCHRDQTSAWAAKMVAAWRTSEPREHFAVAIETGRTLGRGTGTNLMGLIGDATQPAIARATALSLLPAFALEDTVAAVRMTAGAEDGLLRAAAAGATSRLPPQVRPSLIQPLLDDPMRLVRIEAARSLAVSRPHMSTDVARRLDRELEAYKQAQTLNADQPQAHVNLGVLYVELGLPAEAEQAYKTALEVGPYFIPAYVNFADLERARGHEKEAEKLLRQGLQRAPEDAALHHALGLALVRQGRSQEALGELRRAQELDAANPRYAYVYGVALNSLGQREEAVRVLRAALDAHPADLDVAVALATIQRDAGNDAEAQKLAKQIAAEWPNSQAAQRFAETMVQGSKLKDQEPAP